MIHIIIGFMDITVIFAIIISTIVTLGIVILVILLFFYHWRNQEVERKNE